jgi:flagellar motility protein MotE (MotC chaperone)
MKNVIISGAIGVIFMVGGFAVGMKFMPKPPASAAGTSAATPGAATAASAPDPISIEALKKTSDSMMTLNKALEEREQKVAAREQAAKAREDELDAERAALNSSHEKFKTLFAEFQSRLQLVDASQVDQLQKQAALYEAMGSDQAIEMIKAMDDPAMTRLFSVMDTKPLSKLVGDWKTKYPADIPRLLQALNGMAQVLPKDKIALDDSGPSPDSNASGSTPPPANPAPAAPAADAPSPAPASSDAQPAPASSPDGASVPVPTPAPATDSTAPSDSAPALPQPPDPNPGRVSTATTN